MDWQALFSGALTVLAPVTADEDSPRAPTGLSARMAAKYAALGPPPSAGERGDPAHDERTARAGHRNRDGGPGDDPSAVPGAAAPRRSAPAGPRLADRRALAREYVEVGNTALAVRLFEQAYGQAPGDPDVLSELADALAADGRYAEAETALRSALLMPTDRPPSLLPVAGFAWLLRLRGRAAEAEVLTRPGLTRARLRDVLDHLDLPAPAAEDDDQVPAPAPSGPSALPGPAPTDPPPDTAPPRRDRTRRAGPPASPPEAEQTVLERRVEELRAFEREYRVRLKSFLENQLRDLEVLAARAADDPPGGDAGALATEVRAFEVEHITRLRSFMEAQLRQVRETEPGRSDDADRSRPAAYAGATGVGSRPREGQTPWQAGGGGPTAIVNTGVADAPRTTRAGLPRRTPRPADPLPPAVPPPEPEPERTWGPASRSRLGRGLADASRRLETGPPAANPPPDTGPDDGNESTTDSDSGDSDDSGSGEGRG